MGKLEQYKAIPSSVHLERGYCCDNGCVNCPYKKARELKSAYEETGDPQHTTLGAIGDVIADRVSNQIQDKLNAAFAKGLIIGAIIAILSVVAGYNF